MAAAFPEPKFADTNGIRITGEVHGAGTQPCVATAEPVPFLVTERIALLLTQATPEGGEIDQIAELIDLNVTAPLQLTHRLLPLLRQQGEALVINLGSTFGSIGYPGFSAYCASKFALRGFSEALRRELADTQVKVLYFAPRATRTGMNAASVVAMNDELNVAMDDPHSVAQQLLAAIRREEEERYLGWPEKLFVRLNSLLPRVVDQALRKQLPIIQRFARSKP